MDFISHLGAVIAGNFITMLLLALMVPTKED